MENKEQVLSGGLASGENGVLEKPAAENALNPQNAYVDINAQGWVTAKIHLSKGLYAIIGFLAEVQDIVRAQFIRAAKKEQESKIVKPGFRGFRGLFSK